MPSSLRELLRLIKEEPLQLPPPESWGKARVTPAHRIQKSKRRRRVRRWDLPTSPPSPLWLRALVQHGPGKTKTREQPPENRGLLAEDRAAGPSPLGRAAIVEGREAFTPVGVTPAGFPPGPAAKSCLRAWGGWFPAARGSEGFNDSWAPPLLPPRPPRPPAAAPAARPGGCRQRAPEARAAPPAVGARRAAPRGGTTP